MKKIFQLAISIFFYVAFVIVPFFCFANQAHADVVTDNGVTFLKSKQDASGRITTGFSAPSQWSAIAFAIEGIDVSTVKTSGKSLLDFLVSDIPTNNAATDWENRILAIVAIGQNPTNFGGTNYVSNLEGLYANGQIGDTCSLNDDVFGLLALLAAGNTSSTTIKQSTLDFLLSKQDPTDGGFGFSAPGCAWYATSADMTGAALQALVEAKNHGFSSTSLDTAIQKAKDYLVANQDSDGGYGYYGSSDPDTTGWVLQAFNVAGMKDSNEAAAARKYLLAQQSATDGGFQAFDWGANALVSNSTTTAQSIIALSGNGWIVKVYDPSVATPTLTVAPTASAVTPTPTPTTSSTSPNTASPTVTPTPTIIPTASPTGISEQAAPHEGFIPDNVSSASSSQQKVAPTGSDQQVLGATDQSPKQTQGTPAQSFIIPELFAGGGIGSLFLYFVKPFILRKIYT